MVHIVVLALLHCKGENQASFWTPVRTGVQRDRSNRLFSVAALHCFLTTVHILGIDGLHGNVLCSVKVL